MNVFNRQPRPVDRLRRTSIIQRFLPKKQKPTEEVQIGDKIPDRPNGQKVKAEELKDLRELIRRRYALDIEIWEFRDVLPADRQVVLPKLVQADALLAKIRRILVFMDRKDIFENENQYKTFCDIKDRMLAPGKRVWTKQPPWEHGQIPIT
jgi:hypothetical protein